MVDLEKYQRQRYSHLSDVDLTEYIGIPFKDGGADVNGLDCLGLISLWLNKAFGIVLLDDKYLSLDKMVRYWNDKSIQDAIKDLPVESNHVVFNQINKNDILLFSANGTISHIGISASSSTFIHVTKGAGVTSQRLEGWFRKNFAGGIRICHS